MNIFNKKVAVALMIATAGSSIITDYVEDEANSSNTSKISAGFGWVSSAHAGMSCKDGRSGQTDCSFTEDPCDVIDCDAPPFDSCDYFDCFAPPEEPGGGGDGGGSPEEPVSGIRAQCLAVSQSVYDDCVDDAEIAAAIGVAACAYLVEIPPAAAACVASVTITTIAVKRLCSNEKAATDAGCINLPE